MLSPAAPKVNNARFTWHVGAAVHDMDVWASCMGRGMSKVSGDDKGSVLLALVPAYVETC